MIRKTITIEKKQAEWLEKNHVNLSGLVQDMLREKMKEAEKK